MAMGTPSGVDCGAPSLPTLPTMMQIMEEKQIMSRHEILKNVSVHSNTMAIIIELLALYLENTRRITLIHFKGIVVGFINTFIEPYINEVQMCT